MTIKERIKEQFERNNEQTVKELYDQLMVSKQAIHLALNQLVNEGSVVKFGRTPKTVYRLVGVKVALEPIQFDIGEAESEFLNVHFLLISELGEMKYGAKGFYDWSMKRGLPFAKTVKEFIQTKKKYQGYYSEEGMIDGSLKLKNTTSFDRVFLDEIFYVDFYAIERFGKTKLGTLLHYAKQGQNKFLMNILVNEIREKVLAFVAQHEFDAICYVPPTIRRETQIMKFLETHLHINLPKIQIHKLSGIIPVPQKSLSKIDERINNARSTFAIAEVMQYKRVLLIDDAVGSGATMNQIAEKILDKKVAESVTGLAIVGSFKGFDVITDI